MSERRYALVPGGKLHRYPAYEDCNLDDAERVEYVWPGDVEGQDASGKALADHYDLCARCFPGGILGPQGER